MRLFLLAFCFVFVFNLLFAQTRRVVLLEEATNASCSPCAAYNPTLQKFYSENFGAVVSVRYHAWWPGSSDPMYVSAASDCRNRIGYYGIQAVPTYVLDGKVYGVPADADAMTAQLLKRLEQPSPVKIHIRAQFNDDSVHAQIQLIALQNVPPQQLKLRTAITQRLVVYNSPPGSNGEKEFPEVLRQLLPSADGIAIDSLSAGDTLRFSLSAAVKNDWEVGDLAVVSWLQSDASKEVLQAGIHFPTFILQADTNGLQFLKAGQSKAIPLYIANDNDTTALVRFKFKNINTTSGWSYELLFNGGVYNSTVLPIPPGDTLRLTLNVTSGNRGSLSLQVMAENMNDDGFYGEGYGYGTAQSFTFVVPENNDVLLVDDDGGKNYEDYFTRLLDKQHIAYLLLKQKDVQGLSKQYNLNNYRLIIWNISWGFPAFTPNDVALLTSYLDNGGNLVLFGQDIAWDVFDSQGNSHFKSAMDFLQNYFDLKFISDNSKGIQMSGVAGDPIGDSLSFDLARPYGFSNFYPEEITSNTGQAKPVFKYNNGKIGVLRYDSGTYRTVFFGIGFEQIGDETSREIILSRLLKWCGNITALPEKAQFPVRSLLVENYPNPFNGETFIKFTLPNKGKVKFTLFNLRGQKVRTWPEKLFLPGTHRFHWDGTDNRGRQLPSGLYVLQVTSGHFKKTHKLLLIR